MDYKGWLTVRALKPAEKELFVPSIHTDNMPVWYAERGKDVLDKVFFQEIPPPDSTRIINFEVRPHSMPDGFVKGMPDKDDVRTWLTYSAHSNLNLRHDLLVNGKHVQGLAARVILKHYLAEDIDMLHDIWEEYPDATIEGSRFSSACGVFKRKTVIWECRDF
jgi:hypothetical protein